MPHPVSQLCSRLFIIIALLTPYSVLGHAQNHAASSKQTGVTVPFVGCGGDGQVGPIKAPSGRNKPARISHEAAQHLAYYKSKFGFGVLAPRGWHCFSTYGSNGTILYVSPTPIEAPALFSSDWKGFTGPAIQISATNGDTSGRFEVAEIIARLFPSRRQFVQDVIAEDILPASSFPFGPYPEDKLTYRTKQVVEFHTPKNTEGMGTRSRLSKDGEPIDGVAILFGEEPDLLLLSLRLPTEAKEYTQTIIQQVEREAERVGRESQF